ncbi:MAG: cyclic nucleotide-binding domain-containing protein [Spirochaetales bacterium]|nr:cyclic nucleotide-binding domain-containing protein [Spirochaetales bacterium]
MDVIELLRRIHPFRFLRDRQRRDLARILRSHRFAPGETIFRQHDVDQSVFLIACGSVEVFDPRRPDDDLVTIVEAYRAFGEWEAIFQEPRLFSARARTECECCSMSGAEFRSLLRASPSVAQGFGTILRDNQGIFSAFDRFKFELLQGAERGHIGIGALVPLYLALQPALHPKAHDEYRIDTGALTYAVRRLPDNLTRTFAFLLVDELPAALAGSERLFPVVPTRARRRDVWEVLPGKDLVLLRTGDSDLIDLVTCLCVYAVEARKIRKRIGRDGSLARIAEFLADGAHGPDEIRTFLNTLSFSSREVDALVRIWPDDAAARISEVARHREMFDIDVRRRQRTHLARRGELWIAEVARVNRELTGLDPADLPPRRGVHIVSSNTHSVTNCLNPWFVEHRAAIERWAVESAHPALDVQWENPDDLVYSLARDFFLDHPDRVAESQRVAGRYGHHRLEETASTGIRVQLVDLASLVGVSCDSGVAAISTASSCRDDVIVNIDYAFGEQAEHVIRNLLMLYGRNIRSVNFLGKAGALVGRRGDILAPTAFIAQHSDLLRPLASQSAPRGATVHRGPMLTVDGTLLQNRQMLQFYRQIRDVVGIEMEGMHYYREILESQQLGVIGPDVEIRSLYYISDLPLEAGANLAAPLTTAEGVPPLYTITRHILNQIITGGTR